MLNQFYATQLHEYEPILQVQRTLLYGNSCSRELRSSVLKRKYDEPCREEEDSGGGGHDDECLWTPHNRINVDRGDVLME